MASTVVIVMGMHRSGTSLIANILRHIGVDMGKRFGLADEANPEGYWEDLDFQELNKLLLKKAGGTWNRPPGFFQIMGAAGKLDADIRKLITRRVRSHAGKLWGWKDPRNIITLGAYMPHLRNQNVKIIIPLRDSKEIAASLMKIHGKNQIQWLRLNDFYQQAMKRFTQNYKDRFISLNVNYAALVDRSFSRSTVCQIYKFIYEEEIPQEMLEDVLELIRYPKPKYKVK